MPKQPRLTGSPLGLPHKRFFPGEAESDPESDHELVVPTSDDKEIEIHMPLRPPTSETAYTVTSCNSRVVLAPQTETKDPVNPEPKSEADSPPSPPRHARSSPGTSRRDVVSAARLDSSDAGSVTEPESDDTDSNVPYFPWTPRRGREMLRELRKVTDSESDNDIDEEDLAGLLCPPSAHTRREFLALFNGLPSLRHSSSSQAVSQETA